MGKTIGAGEVWGVLLVAGTTPTAFAQVPEPSATPTPVLQVPPVVVPTAPPLPISTPAVVATPRPASTPTPRPTPVASPTSRPTPRPSPTASPSPTATASPTPQSTETPAAVPTVAAPPAVATPIPVATAAPAAAPVETFDWLPWLLGAAGLLLLALLWVRYRREGRADPPELADEPQPEAAPAAAAPVYRTSGPWLTITVRPVRAGLNMITAVADCEITVTNEGAAPADQVRTALSLLAAHTGQQTEIAAANAEPITRSVVPAFALQPGEARTFRGVASASIDALPTMQAGGREMLVPLVLLNVQHRDPDGVEHRTSQGFVVGIERVDSPKLAPFWIDSIRMVEQVAARPSGAPERRRIGA